MTLDSLARHYATLTPAERVPLLLAAAARGDTQECQRLTRSTPTITLRLADCWSLAYGLQHLASSYLLRQLEVGRLFAQVATVLARQVLLVRCKQACKPDKRTLRFGQALAHQLVVRADGWNRLCKELHIQPALLLGGQPGYEYLCTLEVRARRVACTPKQALACLRGILEYDEEMEGKPPTGPRRCRLETAEDVARTLREELDELVAGWC
jgi:hypothetical protein